MREDEQIAWAIQQCGQVLRSWRSTRSAPAEVINALSMLMKAADRSAGLEFEIRELRAKNRQLSDYYNTLQKLRAECNELDRRDQGLNSAYGRSKTGSEWSLKEAERLKTIIADLTSERDKLRAECDRLFNERNQLYAAFGRAGFDPTDTSRSGDEPSADRLVPSVRSFRDQELEGTVNLIRQALGTAYPVDRNDGRVWSARLKAVICRDIVMATWQGDQPEIPSLLATRCLKSLCQELDLSLEQNIQGECLLCIENFAAKWRDLALQLRASRPTITLCGFETDATGCTPEVSRADGYQRLLQKVFLLFPGLQIPGRTLLEALFWSTPQSNEAAAAADLSEDHIVPGEHEQGIEG